MTATNSLKVLLFSPKPFQKKILKPDIQGNYSDSF